MIRVVKNDDAEAIAGIYNYYIANTVITFEEAPVDAGLMNDRITSVTTQYPWYVWEEKGEIIGYAYAHRWHERAAYRYAAEDSIYIKPGYERRGIGQQLLGRVIEDLRRQGIHVLMAVIAVPNEGSVGLHEKLGFKKAGQFNEIGYKLGKRRDVGYWELILEGEK
ncbi:MAG: GNAT family N-acetyltransferase [Treponema sp.]|jgi:phosphinothricin acetyltransferase|nr:GNAT family N-acetyltransferase [Treponema sp.]